MGTPWARMSREQRDRANQSNRKWKAKNREKICEYKRKHYLANRDKYLTLERDRQYRARYGITLADYDRMLSEQDGKCKICKSDKAGKTGQCFAVDHCHSTGKVRGLLCIDCNGRLAWYEKHASAAAAYLVESANG